ncbi:hypothetical protein [Flavobacterium sp. GT3P67]|uniref:hypothetical protein n=1 Tax=Flavobacterium sp. GT3P67 TaxID=2541722 RepID=UPI001044794C|nr:hypothetical protein [Flavobacterium sp. GT3P67]TDE52692.1 hypothetical protein E0H99_11255 [Flavobacterium sp. GT3P67]
MKKLSYILIIAIITVIGCTTETLKDKTVIELIRKEYHYPRIIDYDIYCSDPEHAQKVLKSGLEEKGMVTVKRTQELKDIGSPLIYFTDAAKPYFLITSEDDKKSDIQKVKIADEEFGKIEDIKIWNSGKMAIVTFSSVRKNTIFGELLRKASPIIKQHKAYFLLTQNGWQIMDQSDVDLLLLNY